jgi:2-keto-3-deoxy-6-phosphogluconate aldolase
MCCRRVQIELAASAGCVFALSPVNAKECDFIQECHRRGILAVPAAFTPQVRVNC